MWGAGYATGIGVGFALGLVVGTLLIGKQKRWSELTDKEKRTRKIAIGAGALLLLLGIAALVWALLSR
jgi:cytochrome c biogenesis protein CcdA